MRAVFLLRGRLRCAGALLVLAVLIAIRPAAATELAKPLDTALEPTPSEPPPNHVLPAAEILLALGAASAWYWIDDRNVLDWDNPSIEQRLTGEAWRFDNNTFGLNYVAHPLAGAGFYVLARGNRLGVWPSFGYAVVGSTIWEYVIEFKEKVSINDMIITPGAGLPIGEFFHKLAWYLSSVPPRSAGQSALGWTLGLSVQGHRELAGLSPPAAPALDALGYSRAMWHQFAFQYGFGVIDPTTGGGPEGTHALSFEGELVSLPGYRRAGQDGGRWFYEAEVARLDAELDAASRGVGVEVFAETLAAGYHYQRISPLRRAALAATVGASVAYQFRRSKTFGYDDRQGLLLAPGLAGDFSAKHGRLSSRLRLGAYPSFGALSALSYPEWRSQMPGVRTKTVVQREGYFYSWGWTGRVSAALGFAPVEFQADLQYGRHRSIDGLDRAQEHVSHDAPLSDVLAEAGISLWLSPPELPVELGLTWDRRRRASRMGGGSGGAQTPLAEAFVEGQRLLLKTGLRL